jgi:ATP-dependent DNA helicase RecQ
MEDLDGVDPVAKKAKSDFGIPYLFPLQRMAVANVLDASQGEEDFRQLVLFPTGFGKSLCFQLPSLLAPGLTLVVYPLLALMNDQKRSLDARGIRNSLIRGGMAEEERKKELEAVAAGRSRILITNPETLGRKDLREFLARIGVFHFAIDEAHCVSEWGETFRPGYLSLGEYIAQIRPKVVSAFTATASPQVVASITRYLFGEASYSLVTADMDKPNLRYSVVPTLSPLHSLARLIREKPRPLIVFDRSRAGVALLCEEIGSRVGLEVKFYHAGLTKEEKANIERWFMASADGVLVATCAYGMGVDKKNIRTVIHFRLPSSVEAYIQEAGRAGRDGEIAHAILIDDRRGLEVKPPSGQEDDARRLRSLAFAGYAVSSQCRREHLHRLMGGSLEGRCSGCDVCEGTFLRLPEGQEEIMEFFRANSYRFERKNAIRLLSGCPDTGGLEPPACAGSGSLATWDRIDIDEAVAACISQSLLREKDRGFRKGRLGCLKAPLRCKGGA